MNIQPINPLPGESLMDLGIRCGAVYVCRKLDGVRQGPLVVYAGKDSQERNLVGDIYFNFRKIERHPRAVEAFAETACAKLAEQGLLGTFDTFCGIPQGGRTLGQMLALVGNKRFAYADKKPIPTQAGRKQEYEWDLSQFEFDPNERVAIAEDVFNNFQNTDNTIAQVVRAGAVVHVLVGALNRSPIVRDRYAIRAGDPGEDVVPVVAAINEPYPEYEQDDPAVATDIAAGKLELEVKKNWSRLCATMNA